MRMISRFITLHIHAVILSMAVLTLLQGCVEKGAIVVTCVPGEEGPQGCTPAGYSGSATGFRSLDGVTPVPASANAMCSANGSWKCATENQGGCSLDSRKKCKSYYYYTSANIVGQPNYCECRCVLP